LLESHHAFAEQAADQDEQGEFGDEFELIAATLAFLFTALLALLLVFLTLLLLAWLLLVLALPLLLILLSNLDGAHGRGYAYQQRGHHNGDKYPRDCLQHASHPLMTGVIAGCVGPGTTVERPTTELATTGWNSVWFRRIAIANDLQLGMLLQVFASR
jgi:hypothetical protein